MSPGTRSRSSPQRFNVASAGTPRARGIARSMPTSVAADRVAATLGDPLLRNSHWMEILRQPARRRPPRQSAARRVSAPARTTSAKRTACGRRRSGSISWPRAACRSPTSCANTGRPTAAIITRATTTRRFRRHERVATRPRRCRQDLRRPQGRGRRRLRLSRCHGSEAADQGIRVMFEGGFAHRLPALGHRHRRRDAACCISSITSRRRASSIRRRRPRSAPSSRSRASLPGSSSAPAEGAHGHHVGLWLPAALVFRPARLGPDKSRAGRWGLFKGLGAKICPSPSVARGPRSGLCVICG